MSNLKFQLLFFIMQAVIILDPNSSIEVDKKKTRVYIVHSLFLRSNKEYN